MIETVDRDIDLSIKNIYIDLIELPLGTKTINLLFSGLKNPNYVNRANLKGILDVSVLGGSLDRVEIRAQASTNFTVDLKPYGFAQLSLFSTSPWPGEPTQLEIEWSMTNRISFEEVY